MNKKTFWILDSIKRLENVHKDMAESLKVENAFGPEKGCTIKTLLLIKRPSLEIVSTVSFKSD